MWPILFDPALDARLISFGVIEIDGQRYEHDVVLDRGVIRKCPQGRAESRGRPEKRTRAVEIFRELR